MSLRKVVWRMQDGAIRVEVSVHVGIWVLQWMLGLCLFAVILGIFAKVDDNHLSLVGSLLLICLVPMSIKKESVELSASGVKLLSKFGPFERSRSYSWDQVESFSIEKSFRWLPGCYSLCLSINRYNPLFFQAGDDKATVERLRDDINRLLGQSHRARLKFGPNTAQNPSHQSSE